MARRSRCPPTPARVSCWRIWRSIRRALSAAARGLLRPDVAEASARKTLRDAVYELRRAFAPAEPVVATREAVSLRAHVDLAAFARLQAGGVLEACAGAGGSRGAPGGTGQRLGPARACRARARRRRRADRAGRAAAGAAGDRALLPRSRRRRDAERAGRRGRARGRRPRRARRRPQRPPRRLLDAGADRGTPGRRDRDDRGGRGGTRPRGRAAGPQLARRGPDGARLPGPAGGQIRRLPGTRGRRRARPLPLVCPHVAFRRWRNSGPLERRGRAPTRRSSSPPRPRTRWRRGWCARNTTARSRSAGAYDEIDRDRFSAMAAASAEPWAWLTVAIYIDAAGGREASAARSTGRGAERHQPAGHRQLARGGRAVRGGGDPRRPRGRRAADTILAPNARLFPVVARGGICIGSAQYFVARLASTLGRTDEAELGCAARSPRTCGSAPPRGPRSRCPGSASSRAIAPRCSRPPRGRTHSRCTASRSAPAPPPTPRWPTPRNPSGTGPPARPGRAGSPAARRRAPRR